MERTYSYKGCRPYGAGDLFVMDHYVNDDFVGNVPEEIIKNNGGKWDDDKLILTMPSGVEVKFLKEKVVNMESKIVHGDHLYSIYKQLQPSDSFFRWLSILHECGIVTHLETNGGDDYLLVDLFGRQEEV